MKRIIFLAILFIVARTATFAGTATLNVVEDDCVRSDGKATSPGKMLVYNNGSIRIDTYLKFDLSGFSSIESATLKVTIGGYSASARNASWAVEMSENDWTEGELTWSNRPAALSGTLAALGPNIGGITASSASWMESSKVKITLDIPLNTALLQQRLVAGTSVVTLRITVPSTVSSGGEIDIASKESAEDGSINRSDLVDCEAKLDVTGAKADNLVTLGSLMVDGTSIEGFSPGLTGYSIKLQAPVTDYPAVVATPADNTATVSVSEYNPVVFDADVTNTVSFTVSNGENSATYTINFTVDKMPELCNLYMERVRQFNMAKYNVSGLDGRVTAALALWQESGRFSDIDYTDRNGRDKDWESLVHVERMRDFVFAYTMPGSGFYENEDLYNKIVISLSSWVNNHPPTCENWWFNWIPEPQYLGVMLIQMRIGKNKIDAALEKKVTDYMSANGGTPGVSPAYSAANRMDVAVHWFYRACLTLNETVLETAMTQYCMDFRYVAPTAEGLQADGGFFQHGTQFYIGGYGDVFINGALLLGGYTAGTKYALNVEQTELLGKFVRESFYGTVRGGVQSWSIGGRGYLSRPGAVRKSAAYAKQFIPIDTANTAKYEEIVARVSGAEKPSYAIEPVNRQFFIGDYALHSRPAYLFDVRMASTRTVRIEYGNYENLRTFFAADGCTDIMRTGEEYEDIFPVWNWAHIPGITCPQVPDDKIPLSASDMSQKGTSTFAGGVTDSVYGVTAYSYEGSHTGNSARKGWFMFDDEVVCLGAGINSVVPSNSYVRQNDYDGRYFNSADWMTAIDQYEINTTVNQACLKGDVSVLEGGSVSTLSTAGDHKYAAAPDWVWHDSIGYFFPQGGEVWVSNKAQSGSWYDINRSYSADNITKNVFTLWLNHGKPAVNGTYAYIVVPGLKSPAEMNAYKSTSAIEILSNTDSMQVVYHKDLKIYGLIFFKPCAFKSDNLTVEAGAACAVLVKNADTDNVTVVVADPQRQASPVKLGVKTPLLAKMKAVTYANPASPYQGQSKSFTVNNDSPEYAGKDILLDRSEWTIITSYAGITDTNVGGNHPENMIDGNDITAFLFVKPGKTYGGLTVEAGQEVSFTIDLKKASDMTYLLYRHRDYNNTTAGLRATDGSFYGKIMESDAWTPIAENFDIATNVTEQRIEFPAKISYRYVKFVVNAWDTSSGNTVQVSEFNLGNTVLPKDLNTDISTTLPAEDTDMVRYYNLQGMEVISPQRGNIYIVKQGVKARKVMVR